MPNAQMWCTLGTLGAATPASREETNCGIHRSLSETQPHSREDQSQITGGPPWM